MVSCRLEREPRERGGQSKGYGFIEYNRRGVAAKVQQLLTDNLFLLGASPRPVHVEFAIDEGGADGAPIYPNPNPHPHPSHSPYPSHSPHPSPSPNPTS